MLKKCYPKYCVKSVYELDERFYTSNGIKAVIFDIDNTLVTHDTPVPPQELLEYFEQHHRSVCVKIEHKKTYSEKLKNEIIEIAGKFIANR